MFIDMCEKIAITAEVVSSAAKASKVRKSQTDAVTARSAKLEKDATKWLAKQGFNANGEKA